MKVFIERKVYNSMLNCIFSEDTISIDLIKPYILTNDEWAIIKPLVEDITDGKTDCYKKILYSDFEYNLEAIINEESWGILTESAHYYIRRDYEHANLYRKPDSKLITQVGDFYGEPEDAYIDPEERFCITVGCGIIKYNIQEPYKRYKYDTSTLQWIEAGREGDILWCDHFNEVAESYFVVSLEDGKLCRFNIDTLVREDLS